MDFFTSWVTREAQNKWINFFKSSLWRTRKAPFAVPSLHCGGVEGRQEGEGESAEASATEEGAPLDASFLGWGWGWVLPKSWPRALALNRLSSWPWRMPMQQRKEERPHLWRFPSQLALCLCLLTQLGSSERPWDSVLGPCQGMDSWFWRLPTAWLILWSKGPNLSSLLLLVLKQTDLRAGSLAPWAQGWDWGRGEGETSI